MRRARDSRAFSSRLYSVHERDEEKRRALPCAVSFLWILTRSVVRVSLYYVAN